MLDSVLDTDSIASVAVEDRWRYARKRLSWNMRRQRIPWMGWWYAAISAGFVLLALYHVLVRDVNWLIGVRLVIAGGFGLLAWMELKR